MKHVKCQVSYLNFGRITNKRKTDSVSKFICCKPPASITILLSLFRRDSWPWISSMAMAVALHTWQMRECSVTFLFAQKSCRKMGSSRTAGALHFCLFIERVKAVAVCSSDPFPPERLPGGGQFGQSSIKASLTLARHQRDTYRRKASIKVAKSQGLDHLSSELCQEQPLSGPKGVWEFSSHSCPKMLPQSNMPEVKLLDFGIS